MNYIINPSWFYWLDVVDGIKTVMLVVAIVAFLFTFLFWGVYFFSMSDFYDYHERERTFTPSKHDLLCKKLGIITLVMSVVSVVGLVFIPSKDALIEMQVAKMATYENAQWTVDSLKSVVDYIISAIQSMK